MNFYQLSIWLKVTQFPVMLTYFLKKKERLILTCVSTWRMENRQLCIFLEPSTLSIELNLKVKQVTKTTTSWIKYGFSGFQKPQIWKPVLQFWMQRKYSKIDYFDEWSWSMRLLKVQFGFLWNKFSFVLGAFH